MSEVPLYSLNDSEQEHHLDILKTHNRSLLLVFFFFITLELGVE